MLPNTCLLCVFVIIWQPTFGFYNLCHSSKNTILDSGECSDLYFDTSEKATSLGQVKLELHQDSLVITPQASSWTKTFLKITDRNNETNFCSQLSKNDNPEYCFTFTPGVENETFLVEYRVENLPEISSRIFLFFYPNWKEVPLFLYIDQTDKARLVLRSQKLPSANNASYYQVEAYKERNGNTNLLDLRVFRNEEINYELFTYKDMGYYFFVVSEMNENCTDNICVKISTPKVYIERKSTRVVIGIVGASFILPFILVIFHILTKNEETKLQTESRLVVAYKSSSKKHNEVVFSLSNFIEKVSQNYIVDIIDLAKPQKKFSEKFCTDSLLLASRIVYVASPQHDSNPIYVDKSLSEKEFIGVIFDHCVDKLPDFFAGDKIFRLFDDFDKFLRVLNIGGDYDSELYLDLVKKAEEAKFETDSLNADALPKIIVTESEPHEGDSLLSTKIVL